MTLLPQLLRKQLTLALEEADAEIPEGFQVAISLATDARFGDYQSNSAMILAKRLKQNPRELAQAVVDAGEWDGLCETPEIAGPGFINFKVTTEILQKHTLVTATVPHRLRLFVLRLGIPLALFKILIRDFADPIRRLEDLGPSLGRLG